jgi:hypothetical protein
MQRIRIAAPLALLALAAPAAAQPAPPVATVRELHAVADRNEDGVIDRHEFATRQVDVFYFQDANKDGALTAAELPKNSGIDLQATDRNGDGKLQLPEFLEARDDQFEAADANHDGALTLAELEGR